MEIGTVITASIVLNITEKAAFSGCKLRLLAITTTLPAIGVANIKAITVSKSLGTLII